MTRFLRDYAGRSIRLTEERQAHILKHPELSGLKAGIEQSLLQPERVVQSLSDPDARLYYRMYVDTRLGQKYLCVIVKVVDDDAFVVTAYLTDGIERGVPIWPATK